MWHRVGLHRGLRDAAAGLAGDPGVDAGRRRGVGEVHRVDTRTVLPRQDVEEGFAGLAVLRDEDGVGQVQQRPGGRVLLVDVPGIAVELLNAREQRVHGFVVVAGESQHVVHLLRCRGAGAGAQHREGVERAEGAGDLVDGRRRGECGPEPVGGPQKGCLRVGMLILLHRHALHGGPLLVRRGSRRPGASCLLRAWLVHGSPWALTGPVSARLSAAPHGRPVDVGEP